MFESICWLKLSHAGICLTLRPHLRWQGFCMSAILIKGPFWYVVITFPLGLSNRQVTATSRGRSWRTSSGSWRWPGEEQAWWVHGLNTVTHANHSKFTSVEFKCFVLFVCLFVFQDPSNPTFREKMKEFMQKFDKNKDGRIEMSEVSFSRCFLSHDLKVFINREVSHFGT